MADKEKFQMKKKIENFNECLEQSETDTSVDLLKSKGKSVGTASSISTIKLYIHLQDIEMGTPERRFVVNFDTSSHYFWLPASYCENYKDPQGCARYSNNRYISANSSTYTKIMKRFEIQYEGINLVGDYASDIFKFENSSKTVRMTFGGVINAPDIMSSDGRGIFGLGYNASQNDYEPPLMSLWKNGLISNYGFSYFLRTIEPKSNEIPGLVFLGGIDSKYFHGDLKYYNCTSDNNTFNILVDLIYTSNSTPLCQNCELTLDAESKFNYVPSVFADFINKQVGAIDPGRFISTSKGNTLIFDCSRVDQLLNLSFVINGFTYSLHGKDLATTRTDWITGKKRCTTNIMGHPSTNVYKMGKYFMRKYYTHFDYENRRIGLAVANREMPLDEYG